MLPRGKVRHVPSAAKERRVSSSSSRDEEDVVEGIAGARS
jgi:hypothetical protein